jgi:hypothetical protein
VNDTQIIIYQSDDGKTKIETRLENETLWLNQSQIAEVFQVDRSGITKHINNIFKDGELDEKSNVQIVHIGGSDKPVKFYKLEVIIAVGYRVRSNQGTKFRQWATTVLKEYLVKGFTMNDELLKEAGGGTQLNLNTTIMKNFNIYLPPLKLQNKFASIVEKIKTIKENQKLKQIEDLHNSLMQKAFKGEVI